MSVSVAALTNGNLLPELCPELSPTSAHALRLTRAFLGRSLVFRFFPCVLDDHDDHQSTAVETFFTIDAFDSLAPNNPRLFSWQRS